MRGFVLVLALVAPGMALAAAPARLGYQGRLMKADGQPETGVVTIRFAVFAAETGGTELWGEDQSVALTDGYYATHLGDVVSLPPSIFDGTVRHLEVSVNGSVLPPRQRIGSVAYALNADSSTNVRGGVADVASVAINGTQVIDSNGRLTGPAAVTAGAGVVVNGQQVGLMSCGANGDVLRWNGSTWECGQSAGPSGPVGPSGPAGPSGPKGDQGDPGSIGATGPKGDQGDPGAIGATGPKGDTGNTGSVGATGATGPAGSALAAGAWCGLYQEKDGDTQMRPCMGQAVDPSGGTTPACPTGFTLSPDLDYSAGTSLTCIKN